MQMVTHLEHMAGAGVGHGDNACLRRQRLQPVCQPILCVLPVLRRGGEPLIDYAAILLLCDQLAKSMLSLNGPTFTAGGGQTIKGKAVHPFLFKMQKGLLDQGKVIGSNVVHRRVVFRRVIGAADADNRNVDIGQQALNFRIVIVGNDAIAEPLFDVFDAGTEIFLDEDIPLRL